MKLCDSKVFFGFYICSFEMDRALFDRDCEDSVGTRRLLIHLCLGSSSGMWAHIKAVSHFLAWMDGNLTKTWNRDLSIFFLFNVQLSFLMLRFVDRIFVEEIDEFFVVNLHKATLNHDRGERLAFAFLVEDEANHSRDYAQILLTCSYCKTRTHRKRLSTACLTVC